MTKSPRDIILEVMDRTTKSERAKRFYRLVNYDLYIEAMEIYARQKVEEYIKHYRNNPDGIQSEDILTLCSETDPIIPILLG